LIEVKIFGSEPPCVYCKRTEEAAKKAAARFPPGEVSVVKHSTHSPEAEGAGFTATPAVVVNGKVVSQGRVPEENELEAVFQSELGG
jgi:glutaredoxin